MAAFPAPGVASDDRLVLRAAVSAYLGRYRGETRLHTESDLRVFLRWCTDHGLDPLAAVRVDIGRSVRWLQAVPRYHPPTVARRGRLLPGLRDRPDPAALPGRLRTAPNTAGRVTNPRARASAVRSPDHHRPPVREPERLRP